MVIALPSTDRVSEQLKRNGNSATFMQVALGLLKKLDSDLKTAGWDWKLEIEFIRSCLRGGEKQTNVPCALSVKHLLSSGSPEDLSKQSTPANPISQETRMQLRRSYHSSEENDEQENENGDILSECSEDLESHLPESSVAVEGNNGDRRKASVRSMDSSGCAVKRKDYMYRGALNAAIGSCNGGGGQKLSKVMTSGCPWMGPAVPPWPTSHFDDVSIDEVRAQFNDQFNSWCFDIFELARLSNNRPLTFIGWEALLRCGLFSNFNVEPGKASTFVQVAESRYFDQDAISYHNNIHAADVTQTTWAILQDFKFSIYFDPMDCSGLIISSIIHDIGHDGKNNAYHTKVLDVFAMRYNDRSVMENYHLASGFELLMVNQSTNFLMGVSIEQLSLFRKEIIEMVLGTDMGQHFTKLTEFNTFALRNRDDHVKWQSDEAAMSALRGMTLHCADISNPAKPMKIAQQWAARCLREFFAQGDLEKRMNLQVSPLCDRDSVNVAESQTGFIQFIVQPTFASLTQLSAVAVSAVLEEIARNELSWQTRREQDVDINILSDLAGLRPTLEEVPTVIPDDRILELILVQSIYMSRMGSVLYRI